MVAVLGFNVNIIIFSVNNEITCPQCMAQYQYWKWREDTKPPGVIRNVDNLKSQAYSSPLPKLNLQ